MGSGPARRGKVRAVIRPLAAERARCTGEQRRAIEGELTYLRAGRDRMAYACNEAEGWPIDSGAIEDTCKHLVKERLCLTGAHWRRANLPHVLALRLSIFNGEWDTDWADTPHRLPQAA